MSEHRPDAFTMLGGHGPACVGDECVVPGAEQPAAGAQAVGSSNSILRGSSSPSSTATTSSTSE